MKGPFFTIVIQIAILGVILYGCKDPQPEAKKLLSQAEIFMEDHPDSAMLLIDSIFYPEKSLNHENYMRFLVLQVQAKYMNNRPIVEDTSIFRARDYYSVGKKEPLITTLAWFYSGCVHRKRREYEEAMDHFQTAAQYAVKMNDFNLQGLVQYNIGGLLAEQGLHQQALDQYKLAAHFYHSIPDKEPQCYSAIGRMYSILQQPDSAFKYFHKGLEIAQSAGRNDLQSLLAQNLSVAYTNEKQYENAELYLLKAFSLNSDSTRLPRYYLNFARLYSGMDQSDSVLLYSVKLKQCIDGGKITDNNLKASIYHFLASNEKANGNFNSAFDYQDKYTSVVEDITKERLQQSVYEVQRKYNYELTQKQYYMDISVRQFWIIVLLAMVMIGGTLSIWYWFRQRKRRNEAQQNIDTLEGMNLELKNEMYQKQTDLRRVLLWRFEVARRVMDLNKEIDKPGSARFDKSHWMKRFNKIVYGKEDVEEVWETLFATFNESRPGLAQKIKEKYPDLTEVEFRVCILVYSGFNINETALILDLKPNTIQSRRSSVRHKMGLDTRGDIAAHIDLL